jgi:glucose uptake protein GlcU
VLSSLSPTAWSLEPGAFISAVETAGSLKTVAIVTAIELAGAALLRMLAIRRWRTLDWLRFKPLSSSAGVRHSP